METLQIPPEIHTTVTKVGLWYLLGTEEIIPIDDAVLQKARKFLSFYLDFKDGDIRKVERSFIQQSRKGLIKNQEAPEPAEMLAPNISLVEPTIEKAYDIAKAKEVKAALPSMEDVLALVDYNAIPTGEGTIGSGLKNTQAAKRSEGTPIITAQQQK